MPERRRIAAMLAGSALTVAAGLGLACIALVTACWTFDLSVVMFRTGSMAPTIPAGSVAIVQEVPSTTVRPGDIVMVERVGRLPVTHRVVAAEPAKSAGAGFVTLTLQGDANSAPDAEVYVVDHVGKVVWSAPRLGLFVARLQHPLVLAGVTVVVAAFVMWTLWPRVLAPAPPRKRVRS